MTETTLKLTAEQQAHIGKMSKVEKEAFEKLSDADKQGYFLGLELTESDETPVGVEFADTEVSGLENIPMLTFFNKDKNPLGLKDGAVIRGRLLGYQTMISKNPIENWEEVEGKDGKTYYKSGYWKLQKSNGDVFGIYHSAQLHPLKKICTAATDPSKYTNPWVEITHVGLIEGKDRLRNEFGIELTKGSSARVFKVFAEKDAVRLPYAEGIVNYLNDPRPASFEKSGLTADQIEERNYEAQLAANEAARQRQLDMGTEGALAQ